MKKRTRTFAVRIARFTSALPRSREADVMARQLLRSGTSVGANYRAACRAKSRPDFIAKMGIVEEEIDEVIYWLEVMVEARIVEQQVLADILKEAQELLGITVASIRTARDNERIAGSCSG